MCCCNGDGHCCDWGMSMIVYHGSNMEVREPKLIHPIRTLDFGPGFYTTLNRNQAIEFAHKVVDRNGGRGVATLNRYSFDEKAAFERHDAIRFDSPGPAWLDFVVANRNGRYDGPDYAIKYGPVANDNVYRTIQLYMMGDLSQAEAIARFKVKDLFNQVVFSDPAALQLLKFEGSEVCG